MNKKTIIWLAAIAAALALIVGVVLLIVLRPAQEPDDTQTEAAEAPEYFLDIFKDGATEYVLVRGDDAEEQEKMATLEFSKYFKKVTGVDIQIVTDFQEKTDKEIVIGETNRSDIDAAMINGGVGGYTVTVEEQRLVILGTTPEWTLMGVRRFFESQFDGKIIDGNNYTLESREQISVSSKIAQSLDQKIYYSTAAYDFDGLLLLGRSVVSYDKHSTENGELFVSENGEFTGHICLSSDKSVELAKADINDYLATHKNLRRITVKQSIADGVCKCEECSKHSPIDNAILFMNRLAEEFGSDRSFDLVFYANAFDDAVATVKAEGYSVLLANEQQLMNLSDVQWRFNFFTQKINEWSEVSDSIYVVSAYVVIIGDYSHQQLLESMPNYDMLLANLEKLVDMNVKALYETQGYHLDTSASYQSSQDSGTEIFYKSREHILRAMAAGLSLTANEYLGVALPPVIGEASNSMIEYFSYLTNMRNGRDYPLATLEGNEIKVNNAGNYYLSDEQIKALDTLRRNIIKAVPEKMTDIIRSFLPAAAHTNPNEDWKYREIFTCYLDIKETQVYSFDVAFNNYMQINTNTKTSFCVDDMAMGHVIHNKKPEGVQMFTMEFTKGYHEFSIGQIYADVVLKATVTIAPSELPEAPTPSETLSNPNASEEAKAVYEYLLEMYGKKTLLGQHARTKDLAALNEYYAISGDYPSIIGLELMSYSGNRPDEGDNDPNWAWAEYQDNVGLIDAAIPYLKQHGGIPTIIWHWYAPLGGHDKSFYTDQADGFSVAKAVTPGTPEYEATIRDMDLIAAQLHRFEDEGIPVLWRPLIEADGGWFWWGAEGPENYIKLYRMMYERFVNYHGLDNLIWVWNAARIFYAEWYPGNDVVDMVSVDTYVEAWNYGSLAYNYYAMLSGCINNGVNKMITLAESGSAPNTDVAIAQGVYWSYQFTFNRQDYYSTRTSYSHFRYLANSECAVMLSDLPEQFRKW